MVMKNEHALRSHCPIASALDVIGDHWTLLVVRDLLLMGKHEYREFLQSEEGISSNILSDRLNRLQRTGLLAWIPHPRNRRRKLYYLTTSGKDLIHVLIPVARWAHKHVGADFKVPEPHRSAIEHNAGTLIQSVFSELTRWEQQYGVQQNR